MDLRYCERCAAEVQDVGGFCLLGHPLRLDPVIPSVSEWRQELDRAFGEARPDEPAEDVPHEVPDDAAEPRRRSLWATLEDDTTDAGDPIAAFAPVGRMDWGPEERQGFVARSLRRRGRPVHA